MRKALMALACFLAGVLVAQINFPKPQGATVKARVVRVIDGDTLRVVLKGKPNS